MTTEMEVNMNSVERLVEYSELQPEAPPVIEASRSLSRALALPAAHLEACCTPPDRC